MIQHMKSYKRCNKCKNRYAFLTTKLKTYVLNLRVALKLPCDLIILESFLNTLKRFNKLSLKNPNISNESIS